MPDGTAKVVAYEPVICLVRTEQRRDLRCQAGADQHHDDSDRQCPGKRVHERLVCTRDVPAADAHGRHRHAADNRKHDNGIEHHHKRPHQIDRTERVRADALPDEDAVDDRKEKIGAVAENGRRNVLQELFHSDVHSASGHVISACYAHARPHSACRSKRALAHIITVCQAPVKHSLAQ